MGTEIVTAHSVRLFRPRIARPYDSPYLHQCRQSLNTTKTEYIFVNGVAGFVAYK